MALLALALAGPVGPRRLFITFSALFAFLALDSLLAIYNRVQDVVGVRRSIPYIPVVLAGAALIVAVWRRLQSIPGATRMLAGGAAAWSVAVGIDSLQTHGEPVWAVVPEEILGMAGSTLFVLALLRALRATTTPSAAMVSGGATAKRAVRVPATPLPRPRGAPHPTAP